MTACLLEVGCLHCAAVVEFASSFLVALHRVGVYQSQHYVPALLSLQELALFVVCLFVLVGALSQSLQAVEVRKVGYACWSVLHLDRLLRLEQQRRPRSGRLFVGISLLVEVDLVLAILVFEVEGVPLDLLVLNSLLRSRWPVHEAAQERQTLVVEYRQVVKGLVLHAVLRRERAQSHEVVQLNQLLDGVALDHD